MGIAGACVDMECPAARWSEEESGSAGYDHLSVMQLMASFMTSICSGREEVASQLLFLI